MGIVLVRKTDFTKHDFFVIWLDNDGNTSIFVIGFWVKKFVRRLVKKSVAEEYPLTRGVFYNYSEHANSFLTYLLKIPLLIKLIKSYH